MLNRVDISWDFRKLGNWWANRSRDQTKQSTLAGFSILEGSKYQLSWTGEKLVISSWMAGSGEMVDGTAWTAAQYAAATTYSTF